MKKSTKGTLAAAAAAVLLLGGAGSLAYWTDDATVDGGTLNSGSIALGEVDCAGWLHVGTDAPVVKIVPGDEVYNDCTTTLTLEGDNIGATLEIDDAAIGDSDLADELEADVALRDSAGDPIDSVDGEGDTDVTARITVDFPYGGPVSTPDPRTGADNDSQNGTAVLDELTLIAVQTNVG